MRSRVRAAAIRTRILTDAHRTAAAESTRIARTTLSFYDVASPHFPRVYAATLSAVYRAVFANGVRYPGVDPIYLAARAASEMHDRLRWRESASGGRWASLLYLAMGALPEKDRIRWLAEWEAELASIPDVRGKRRFVRQTLLGIVRLAIVARRPSRVTS